MTRKTALFFLFAISGLFVLLTVNPLLFQSFWENEADYVLHAQWPLQHIAQSLVPDQSLLYYLLLHFWMKLFGSSEAVTRSLSILFSLGGLCVLYRLSRLLFQDRWIGVLAAFFFATSSFIIEFSQEAKHWTLFVFLTLGSLFFLYRWFEKGCFKDFLIFLGLGLANLFGCLFAFFVFPVQLLFALKNGWRNRTVRYFIFAAGGIILVKSIHLWAGFQYVSSRGAQWGLPARFPDFFIYLHRQLFFYTLEPRIPFLPSLGLFLAFFFFLVGLCRMRFRDTLLISLLFLFPLVTSYFLAGASSIRNRYFIHLLPLFWLSASFGIHSLKSLRLRALAIGVISIATFSSLYQYFTLHRKEDWKGAVAFLAPQLQSNDIVLISPYWVKAGFQFYSQHRFLAEIPGLEDLKNFSRAWVLSVYGEGPVKNGSFPLFEQKNFNKISLRGFDLSHQTEDPVQVLKKEFDLREALESAEVFVLPFDGSRPLPFPYFGKEAYYLAGEERGAAGEGLLYDSWLRRPFSPGKEKWHGVARTVQKSGGLLRPAIWAHPPESGELVIRYSRVRLGEKLSGFYGFTDLSVQHGNAPVRFMIYLGKEKVFEVLKGNSEGWKEFSIDTSTRKGEEAIIEFRIEAANNRWRHFCFNAWIPTP